VKWNRVLILAAALLGVHRQRGAQAQALPLLTSVRQVRELSREQAARAYPVHLRGVITFHDWFLTFVQDATGGIYLRNFDPAVIAGTEVEVEGSSAVGRFLPVVEGGDAWNQAKIRTLGPGQWPQPLQPAAALLDGDAFDSQWVSVRGRVTAVARSHDGVMLDLLSDGVPVRAAIPRWPQNWALPGYLRGQVITARGVVGRRPPPIEDGAPRILLYTPSLESVEVAPEALAGLFDRPREPFKKLFEFESTRDPPFVRIYGQVEFARPGLGFFVFMEKGAWVWVQTSAPGKLAPGDFVDAVGWLDMFDEKPLITDAVFRVEGPGARLPRWQRQASEVKAQPYDTHGAAVTVEGRLVEQQRSLTEDSLVLEDQGVVFLARLLQTGSDRLPVLERGMRLRLGGTCLTKRMAFLENLPSTFAFQLWLTSPADVEVLQRPPWWTVRRVFWLCGVTVLFGAMATIWVVLLRRQVSRQTAVIGGQLERGAVARERARIARELHDSLGQDLVGIALQLDSVAARLPESPQQAEQALNMARMMVRHSQAEAKRSVADIRAEELDSTDLPAALEEVIQPLVATKGPTQFHMEVQGTPRRLEGIVEHHLLRIGQEAVSNAVRHAQAEKIQVLICYRDHEVLIEVKDNGCGFNADEPTAIASGHFGLLGMRERANKLQGRLRIDSRPGAGTVVSVTVPLNGKPAL
jgi:signal transduction histidine kinase